MANFPGPVSNGNDKIYFVSDFHFGVPDYESSLAREKAFIRWLDMVRADAGAIYLMGDVFDFWFEYKTVVPKGFVRLLGKLAELTDSGIPVHLFRGNHDVWAFHYLQREAGIRLHREPEILEVGEKRLYLSHGDGYGPGDHGYKFLRRVFANPLNQWLFRWLHPDLGTRMGLYFSRRSRIAKVAREGDNEKASAPARDRLVQFAIQCLGQDPRIDYFVFGHCHLPADVPLNGRSRCIILGDWVTHFSYAVLEMGGISLRYFPLT